MGDAHIVAHQLLHELSPTYYLSLLSRLQSSAFESVPTALEEDCHRQTMWREMARKRKKKKERKEADTRALNLSQTRLTHACSF